MQELLSYIDNPNIAESLKETKLLEIAQKVIEEYNEDKGSMSDWAKAIGRGMRIAKPAEGPRSEPWEGASNYKSPLLYEAVISFGDRASLEVLGEKNLVKGCIEGVDTPEKQLRMNRVAKFMNWQFNYEMPEWRDCQEQALYALAAHGCFFKKTFFDPTEGKNRSVPIFYPHFAVSQKEHSMSALTRFTEIKTYCKAEVNQFIAAGIWLDQDYVIEDDMVDMDDDSEEGSEEEFLEQHCMLDLDNDGIPEPYIVTVHKSTQKVARIVARFDRTSIMVKLSDGVVGSLDKAMTQAVQSAALEVSQSVDVESTPETLLEEIRTRSMAMLKIVKIKPVNLITKYGFIVAPDGTFLNWGYCHLLPSYMETINTVTNQLIDSGSLANMGGGFVSKEFRNNKTPMSTAPGKFIQTGVDAATMQQGIMPYPFKEPSVGLMTMNEQSKAEARNMTAILSMEGMIAPNAPAATTLGLLQEKMMPTTALIGRILRSMSAEFQKMFDLNAKYTDPLVYQEVLDDPTADYKTDFTRAGYDIEPTAEANKSSMMQKMQSTQVLLETLPIIQGAGGNVQPIVRRVFNAVNEAELAEQVFTQQTDPQMLALQQQQTEAAQMAAQLQQQNNEILQRDHELKLAQKEIEMQKLQLQLQELQLKAKDQQDKLLVEVAKVEAETQRTEADEGLKVAQTYETYKRADAIGVQQQEEGR